MKARSVAARCMGPHDRPAGQTRRMLLAAGLGGLMLPAAQAMLPARGEAVALPRVDLLGGGAIEPADWRGQAAVLVFWATDCRYCERHNAHVEKLRRAAVGRPLRVLGASHDRDPQAVRDYMARHGYGFAVTLQSAALRMRLSERRVVPLTVTLDRGGHLREVIPGQMAEDDVMGLLRLAD